jgi:hypothetical protein
LVKYRTFVGLLELGLGGQVRHGGCDVIYVGGVYALGYMIERLKICIMDVVCGMYWSDATEEEKKKRAEERGSHYIHVLPILSDEEGRHRQRAARQEGKEPSNPGRRPELAVSMDSMFC